MSAEPDPVRRLLLPTPITYELLRRREREHPPRVCLHPQAGTEYRPPQPAGWTRVRRGGRWRLRRTGAGRPGCHVLRCPDCSMWTAQVETPGMAVRLYLPPCLLPTTPADSNGASPWA